MLRPANYNYSEPTPRSHRLGKKKSFVSVCCQADNNKKIMCLPCLVGLLHIVPR